MLLTPELPGNNATSIILLGREARSEDSRLGLRSVQECESCHRFSR
jgi:hypothetical protein